MNTFITLQDSFQSGAIVIVRVLLGEARFVMEPTRDECVGTCSVFRQNPVLQQGDARKSTMCLWSYVHTLSHYFFFVVMFDQRVWTYRGTAWTDVTFITTQLVSLA